MMTIHIYSTSLHRRQRQRYILPVAAAARSFIAIAATPPSPPRHTPLSARRRFAVIKQSPSR
jgi:hypothetical protein